MKAFNFRFLIILFMLINWVGISFAQNDRAALEEDKKKIEEEIQYTNKLLEQTRKTRENSMNEVVILNNKIGKREKLIKSYSAGIAMLEGQISSLNDSVRRLDSDLQNLKDEYAKMIYYAYKNRDMYDRLAFIFSADDFNQAYQRLKYLQRYNDFRKKQAELIQSTREQLEEQTARLQKQKAEKLSLLDEQQQEKDKLAREKSEKDQSVKKLSNKERQLKKTLKQKEQAAKKLQKAIEDIIAEEIRLANERATKAGTKTGSKDDMALTPEEKTLSSNFLGNKGKLPWPVEKGIISGTFGEHPHPVLSHVKVKNNGIDLLTSAGEDARAVFEGVVTRVMSVPNNNNVVIIRHGEFLTVYSNLDKVFVKKGDKVATKQKIGTIYTSPSESKTELHFEVWQAKSLLNPQDWLAGAK
jgi:murein hydrolase activator